MTATELQRIARMLSNQSWCRHWLNYGDTIHGTVYMAVQCRNGLGIPEPVPELEKNGFQACPGFVYTIPRTNEDGTLYTPTMFG